MYDFQEGRCEREREEKKRGRERGTINDHNFESEQALATCTGKGAQPCDMPDSEQYADAIPKQDILSSEFSL